MNFILNDSETLQKYREVILDFTGLLPGLRSERSVHHPIHIAHGT